MPKEAKTINEFMLRSEMLPTTQMAYAVVKHAGEFLNLQSFDLNTVSKSVGHGISELVTSADIKSQNIIIIPRIKNKYANHALLAEELEVNPSMEEAKTMPDLWIIDPLDGTNNYVKMRRGNKDGAKPSWSVCVTYLKSGIPISSAAYLSQFNEVLWVETGKGVYLGDRKIEPNDLKRPDSNRDRTVAFDAGYIKKTEAEEIIGNILLSRGWNIIRQPGECGVLGLLVTGRIGGVIGVSSSIWDYAAGMHAVMELDGKITTLQGEPFDMFSQKGHIASFDDELHSRLVECTKDFIDQS